MTLAPLRCATAMWLMLAGGVPPAAGQPPPDPDLGPLLARAGLRDPVDAACRAEFRPGHPREFAIALRTTEGAGRYVAVQDDGRATHLAEFSGKADLSCYTVTEADRLNANIARSTTINGRVTAEWDGAVICGFVEPTAAVCWQYAPEQRRFVRVGGWTT
ncbi:MAG TPA: hypothetical protein VM032_03560 [Vicinamibacterales bacterium]|nr:hypothetical protein [Vicinamibacterales bacterium]